MRIAIREEGGITLITALLSDPSELVQCQACTALAEMAYNGNDSHRLGKISRLMRCIEESKDEIGITSIPQLCSMLAAKHHEVRAAAAATLWVLAYKSEQNCEAISIAGGVQRLVQLLSDSNEAVVEKAVGALANLAIKGMFQ